MFNWKELTPEEEDKLITQSLLNAGIEVCEDGISDPDVVLSDGRVVPLSEWRLW